MGKTPNAEKIRELNDAFRQTFIGGRVVITAGVNALDDSTKAAAIAKVRAFTAFAHANDPHGEHDFGSFEIAGERLFWKLDYYGVSMEFGSDDPADPSKTTRVLTIMLSEEY